MCLPITPRDPPHIQRCAQLLRNKRRRSMLVSLKRPKELGPMVRQAVTCPTSAYCVLSPAYTHNGLGMTSVHIYSSRWESSTPNHSPSTKHRKPPRMKSFLSLLAILPLALAKPTVYLIRHGEKPSSGNGLSTQGMQRAQCLRNVFGASSSYNIEYILTQDYKKGKKSPTTPFVTPTGTNIVTPW